MYQYVFASVFYCNIDGNNFKLSVHRNPRLIKSHSVIAPLYQPIKFSSKTNWILVTLLWYLFSLWQCSEIVGRIQHHGRESKGQKMIRDFPWAQCIIIIIKKKNKTKQNKKSPRILWEKIFMILKIILVFQSTDKKVLFGYWSSFIPDNTMSASWSLFTIILKDPTPKVGIFSIK